MVDYWSLYSKKVIDHFQHPKNVGEVKNPSGVGRVGSPVCGDIMELQIKVEKKRIKGKTEKIITDAKFRTFGCGAAISTSSMITEMVKGKRISEALKISHKAVAEALDGLPAIKMHCSALAEDALRAAIDDYLRRESSRIATAKPQKETERRKEKQERE